MGIGEIILVLGFIVFMYVLYLINSKSAKRDRLKRYVEYYRDNAYATKDGYEMYLLKHRSKRILFTAGFVLVLIVIGGLIKATT